MPTLCSLIIFSFCFQSPLLAKEKVSALDTIIGSTFKSLAKAFVLTADINNLKKYGVEKINKMEEQKFKRRYVEVYAALKDLPANLKVKYSISKEMTREQAIRNIESLDKRTIYKTIDSIPDSMIAQQFRLYLSKKKQEIQKTNLLEQINAFWAKLTRKVKDN